jgi:hypothetical protein
MRPSFHPTLYQSAGGAAARYLASTDFDSTTNLYIIRADGSTSFTDIYGGIDPDPFGSGLSSAIDHLGNTVNCESPNYNNGISSEESGALLEGNIDWSFFAWVYFSNWANASAHCMYMEISGGAYLVEFDGVDVVVGNDSSFEIETTHGLTGSGWHSIAVTRNVTSTETIIYIDGVELTSVNTADSYTVSSYIEFAGGAARWDERAWQKGVVWTPAKIAALHAIGVGS